MYMVKIIEALSDDDKIVIFKQNGRYKATKKSNYVRRIMDANLVQDLKGFKSAEQIIDYYIKWYKGKLDKDDFIIVDDTKFERKLVGFYDMEDVLYKPYNEWKYRSVEDVFKEAKENEYGEKLYRVYVRTGTAWNDVREVYAYNEQEAVDKVADRLWEEESNLVVDYYDIYDMCEVGETVDDFVEANDLVCAGNNGRAYLGIDRIELVED